MVTTYKIPVLDALNKMEVSKIDTPFNILFNQRVQTGTTGILSGVTNSITFFTPFSSIPKVVITKLDGVTGIVWIESITTTGFVIKSDKSNAKQYNWIAVN